MAEVDFEININVTAALDELKKFGQQAAKAFDGAAKAVSGSLKKVGEGAKKSALSAAKAFGNTAKKIGGQFKKLGNDLGNGFKKVGDAIFSVQGLIAGIGALLAGREILGFINDVTAAASIQEDAVNQLNTALRLTGEFSKEASQDFQDFASELQAATKIGDEVVLSQLALAKSFGASNEQAKDLVAAAADLSAATGITLESAVRNLGKTFGGLTGELGEVVPDLKNISKEALESGAAIDFIAQRFGGAAAAEVNTFSGAVAQLSNIFGDLQEEIGFAITQNPAVIAAIKTLSTIFIELGNTFKDNRETASDFVDTFVTSIVKGIPRAIRAFGDFVRGLQPVAAAIFAIADSVAIVFEKIAVAINVVIAESISAFDSVVAKVKGFTSGVVGFLETIGIVSKDTAASFEKSFEEATAAAAFSSEVAGAAVDDLLSAPERESGTFDNLINGINKVADGAEKAAEVAKEAVDNFDEVKKQAAEGVDLNVNINATAAAAGTGLINVAKSLVTETVDEIKKNTDKLFDPQNTQDLKDGLAFAADTANKVGGVLSGIGSAIGSAIQAGADIITGTIGAVASIFDPQNINQIASFFGEFLTDLPNAILGAFENLSASLDTFIESFPQALTNVIEKLPELIATIFEKLPEVFDALADSLGELFDQLPEILGQVLEAIPGIIAKIGDILADLFDKLPAIFEKIFDALPAIVTAITDAVVQLVDRLPAIFETIFDRLPDLITSILENLPRLIESILSSLGKIIASLIRALPDILVSIIEGIPDILESLIVGLAEAGGEIAIGFIDFLAEGGVEKIVGALIRAIPRIAVALIRGLIRSGQGLAEKLFNPEILRKQFEGIGTNIATQFTDTLGALDPSILGNVFTEAFSTIDADATGQFFTNAFESAADSIGEVFSSIFGNAFQNIGEGLIEGFSRVFEGAFVNILPTILAAFNIPVPPWLEDLNNFITKFELSPAWIENLESQISKLSTTPEWLTKFEETVRKLTGADLFGGDSGGIGGSGVSGGDVLTGGLSRLGGGGGGFGFANGGVIPPGFPNDSFGPAFLTSGETITPAGQTPGGDELMAVAMSLQRLEGRMANGSNQTIVLQLDQEVLANAILGLNQNNARLA